jgi:CDP-diacylglycerol--serine O-phosphatidyltransferase
MVSNFRYRSFKDLDLRNRVPFVAAVIIMLGFALIYLHPPVILFLGFLIYALSGPTLALIRLQQKRARRRELS